MDADKAAELYLKHVKMALTSLLEEAEREGYTTVEQFKGSVHSTLDWISEQEAKV